jgi:hypothetical protein
MYVGLIVIGLMGWPHLALDSLEREVLPNRSFSRNRRTRPSVRLARWTE